MDWDPALHPRAPAGSYGGTGGEFVPRGMVTTGFASKHFGAHGQKLNENNSGIGYVSPKGLTVGVFRNSLDRTSVYAGVEYKAPISQRVDAGVVAGIISGYPDPDTKKNRLRPFLLPELLLTSEDKKNVLAITIVPPVKPVKAGALAIQYRRSF